MEIVARVVKQFVRADMKQYTCVAEKFLAKPELTKAERMRAGGVLLQQKIDSVNRIVKMLASPSEKKEFWENVVLPSMKLKYGQNQPFPNISLKEVKLSGILKLLVQMLGPQYDPEQGRFTHFIESRATTTIFVVPEIIGDEGKIYKQLASKLPSFLAEHQREAPNENPFASPMISAAVAQLLFCTYCLDSGNEAASSWLRRLHETKSFLAKENELALMSVWGHELPIATNMKQIVANTQTSFAKLCKASLHRKYSGGKKVIERDAVVCAHFLSETLDIRNLGGRLIHDMTLAQVIETLSAIQEIGGRTQLLEALSSSSQQKRNLRAVSEVPIVIEYSAPARALWVRLVHFLQFKQQLKELSKEELLIEQLVQKGEGGNASSPAQHTASSGTANEILSSQLPTIVALFEYFHHSAASLEKSHLSCVVLFNELMFAFHGRHKKLQSLNSNGNGGGEIAKCFLFMQPSFQTLLATPLSSLSSPSTSWEQLAVQNAAWAENFFISGNVPKLVEFQNHPKDEAIAEAQGSVTSEQQQQQQQSPLKRTNSTIKTPGSSRNLLQQHTAVKVKNWRAIFQWQLAVINAVFVQMATQFGGQIFQQPSAAAPPPSSSASVASGLYLELMKLAARLTDIVDNEAETVYRYGKEAQEAGTPPQAKGYAGRSKEAQLDFLFSRGFVPSNATPRPLLSQLPFGCFEKLYEACAAGEVLALLYRAVFWIHALTSTSFQPVSASRRDKHSAKSAAAEVTTSSTTPSKPKAVSFTPTTPKVLEPGGSPKRKGSFAATSSFFLAPDITPLSSEEEFEIGIENGSSISSIVFRYIAAMDGTFFPLLLLQRSGRAYQQRKRFFKTANINFQLEAVDTNETRQRRTIAADEGANTLNLYSGIFEASTRKNAILLVEEAEWKKIFFLEKKERHAIDRTLKDAEKKRQEAAREERERKRQEILEREKQLEREKREKKKMKSYAKEEQELREQREKRKAELLAEYQETDPLLAEKLAEEKVERELRKERSSPLFRLKRRIDKEKQEAENDDDDEDEKLDIATKSPQEKAVEEKSCVVTESESQKKKAEALSPSETTEASKNNTTTTAQQAANEDLHDEEDERWKQQQQQPEELSGQSNTRTTSRSASLSSDSLEIIIAPPPRPAKQDEEPNEPPSPKRPEKDDNGEDDDGNDGELSPYIPYQPSSKNATSTSSPTAKTEHTAATLSTPENQSSPSAKSGNSKESPTSATIPSTSNDPSTKKFTRTRSILKKKDHNKQKSQEAIASAEEKKNPEIGIAPTSQKKNKSEFEWWWRYSEEEAAKELAEERQREAEHLAQMEQFKKDQEEAERENKILEELHREENEKMRQKTVEEERKRREQAKEKERLEAQAQKEKEEAARKQKEEYFRLQLQKEKEERERQQKLEEDERIFSHPSATSQPSSSSMFAAKYESHHQLKRLAQSQHQQTLGNGQLLEGHDTSSNNIAERNERRRLAWREWIEEEQRRLKQEEEWLKLDLTPVGALSEHFGAASSQSSPTAKPAGGESPRSSPSPSPEQHQQQDEREQRQQKQYAKTPQPQRSTNFTGDGVAQHQSEDDAKPSLSAFGPLVQSRADVKKQQTTPPQHQTQQAQGSHKKSKQRAISPVEYRSASPMASPSPTKRTGGSKSSPTYSTKNSFGDNNKKAQNKAGKYNSSSPAHAVSPSPSSPDYSAITGDLDRQLRELKRQRSQKVFEKNKSLASSSSPTHGQRAFFSYHKKELSSKPPHHLSPIKDTKLYEGNTSKNREARFE